MFMGCLLSLAFVGFESESFLELVSLESELSVSMRSFFFAESSFESLFKQYNALELALDIKAMHYNYN